MGDNVQAVALTSAGGNGQVNKRDKDVPKQFLITNTTKVSAQFDD